MINPFEVMALLYYYIDRLPRVSLITSFGYFSALNSLFDDSEHPPWSVILRVMGRIYFYICWISIGCKTMFYLTLNIYSSVVKVLNF